MNALEVALVATIVLGAIVLLWLSRYLAAVDGCDAEGGVLQGLVDWVCVRPL